MAVGLTNQKFQIALVEKIERSGTFFASELELTERVVSLHWASRDMSFVQASSSVCAAELFQALCVCVCEYVT